MKEYNKHLGGLFGFAKGVVICLVLTFFIVTMSASARESLKNSQSGKYAAIIMDRLHPVMPDNLHDALAKYIHQLDTDELDLHHRHDHDHADGEHHGDETELGEAQSDPSFISGAGTGSSVPTSSIPLGASSDNMWLPQLRGVFDDEIRRVVARALQGIAEPARTDLTNQLVALSQQMSPSDLISLQQQLDQAGSDPQQIAGVIDAWSQDSFSQPSPAANPFANPGTGTTSGGGAAASSPPDRRQQLIEAISTQFATRPEGQRLIEENIKESLAGIPDQVSLAVLEDWHADLFGNTADPDPGTDQITSLEDRMYRQLQSHGVRLDQVSAEVQRRLRGVVER
jgi:membrane protein required for colicin V production